MWLLPAMVARLVLPSRASDARSIRPTGSQTGECVRSTGERRRSGLRRVWRSKSATRLPSSSTSSSSDPLPAARAPRLLTVPEMRGEQDFSLGRLLFVELEGKEDVFEWEASLDPGLKLVGEEFLDAAT